MVFISATSYLPNARAVLHFRAFWRSRLCGVLWNGIFYPVFLRCFCGLRRLGDGMAYRPVMVYWDCWLVSFFSCLVG